MQRPTLTTFAVVLAVGAGALGIVAPGASAAVAPHAASPHTTPPWEPDADSVGGLVFYNASGDVITSGSTSSSPIAAYVVGTEVVRAGDTRATLFGYLPVDGESPGQWSGEALSLSTVYPNADAPGALTTASPLVTGSDTDESLATLEADFPNDDTTSDGYAGMYQLRLRTSGPDEGLTTTYDSADIMISGSTWTVIYPQSKTSTTTTLSDKPSKTLVFGTSDKLTATVHPSAATGTVDFRANGKLIGAAHVASGVASLTTSALPGGIDVLTATYVAASNATYSGSTSSSVSLKVTPHSTSTKLSAPASATKGHKVTLTATLAPTTAVGSVTFYDGSRKIGSVSVRGGRATIATTSLPTGRQSLKASFKPTSSSDFGASTSKVVIVTVHA